LADVSRAAEGLLDLVLAHADCDTRLLILGDREATGRLSRHCTNG
jgi:hypothetical protein